MNLEILEPSFFNKDVSDEEYFSDAYRDYISNSALGLINIAQGGDPVRFVQGFDKTEKNALLLGTAIHRMVLEKDVYEIAEITKPNGKVGDVVKMVYSIRSRPNPPSLHDAIKASFLTLNYYSDQITPKRIRNVMEKGISFYNFLRKKSENQIVLNEEQKEVALNCIPSVVPYFTKTENIEEYNEFPIFSDFLIWHKELNKYVSVKLKCKIDNFKIDHAKKKIILVDLKTTGSSVSSFIYDEYITYNDEGNQLVNKKNLGSFFKFHYYRQMAMYSFLLENYCKETLGLKDYTIETQMVVVETKYPFRSKLFIIDNDLIKLGEEEFIYLLNKVLFYQDKGFDYIEY